MVRMYNAYDYERSYSDDYILTLDGVNILRGTENDLWKYLHKAHSYSVSWALEFEGYAIIPQGNEGE